MDSSLTTPNEKDLVFRKTIGRSHLSNNQLPEAIEVYAAIIQQYPQDIESYLVLGDLYLAAEDSAAALSLYLKARMLDPENHEKVFQYYTGLLIQYIKNRIAEGQNCAPWG
jgi:cytochrome c-type biogenesis protein CcmH/NrfG